MRRNPLLYSEPSEIVQSPAPLAHAAQEPPKKSSFFFYFIILANSMLVLFVLGFIWFLFLKSPDLQIKEISSRLFGTSNQAEQTAQTIVAPEIQTEVIITPSQQEKDEIQQTKLKQMREKEELAAERVRLEKIKAEIEREKLRATEAKQAIDSLQTQEQTATTTGESTTPSNSVSLDATNPILEDAENKATEIEQTRVEALRPETDSKATVTSETVEQAVVPNAAREPATNTTRSQVDLIMEALKQQESN